MAKIIIYDETHKEIRAFLTKPRGITTIFLIKPRGITTPFLTKPRGMNFRFLIIIWTKIFKNLAKITLTFNHLI